MRRLTTIDRLALLYAAAYVGWLAVRTPGTRTTVIVGTVAFLPLGLAIAWANWRNARVPGLDRRTRLAWSLLGLSALSLWFSGNAWALTIGYIDPETWPSWVDNLEFTQHVFAVAGYLAFPSLWPPRERRHRFLLDIALTVVAGFVLAFDFGARTTLQQEGFGWHPNLLTWSVDWVLFVVASVGFLHKRDRTSRLVMGVLLTANTAYLLANFGFSTTATYQTGDTIDVLWFAAWALRWTAARVAWHRYHDKRPAAREDEQATFYQNATFSYLMVAGAFFLLMVHVLLGDEQFLGPLALSAMLMGVLLVLRQLTELRENARLFSRQLEQEARFRLLIQGSSDVVLVVDEQAAITYVSPSAGRLYGEDCSLRVGVRLDDLVAPDDRSALASLFQQQASADARPFQVRVRVADGTSREVEIAWSDLRADPVVRGVVLNCRDVTERNELERQLRHAQKLDEVGHLAGGLAHDFNNVLTAIRGYAELLRADLANPARAREDLAHVEEAVDRAATVTRKLLSLSRNQPVRRRATDLNAICRDLLPLLLQLVTDRVEVTLDLDPALWPVMADQGQIEQVLLNLATNARDAMPSGGPLRIATANRTLDPETARTSSLPPGDYAAIMVADKGCGMTTEVRARIFEPFFSTKPRERGMGLGLAMVMGIVTDSGGEVLVKTAPGKGTTFTILMPRTRQVASSAARGRAAHLAADAGAPHTILLVDDEVPVRTIAGRMLKKRGYRVREADSGHEALRIARDERQPIDLLLTDLVMPGLHGSELIAQFRQARPGVPVVCMTGFAGEREEGPGLEIAAASILSKPFSSDQLLGSVTSALAVRQ